MEREPRQRRESADLAGIGPQAHARRASFDSIARQYDEMRPGYPARVFDDVCALSGVTRESRLLEIGCGTGHATLPFARRGLRIECIELGEQMAAVARERLAAFDRVRVTVNDFDHWTTETRFDLIYSASAYQWLNPGTRVERIAHLLHPSAWVAVWRNHTVLGSSVDAEFLLASQKIYAREAPELGAKFELRASAEEIPPEVSHEWLASGLFRDVQIRRYTWKTEYNAAAIVSMLDTHSDHRVLPEANRARLFHSLAALVDEFGGTVTRNLATVLEMARKRD
jgi:trans-aconitate methyltransferase